MEQKLITLTELDLHWWPKGWQVYWEAFGEHGGKNEDIIRRMFERKLSFIQLLAEGDEVVAMALSGYTHDRRSIVIDYLTVQASRRGEGIGHSFVSQIADWCRKQQLESIIIEVESDPFPENLARIRFWERCGFQLTDYIHHYIWVPEPYRAMVLPLKDARTLRSGEELFRHITAFHRKAYSKR